MNRTIKFRAWDKRKKKMRLDFAIGSSGEILETGHSCDEGCLGVDDVSDDFIAGSNENELVWNVMQFTGLTDKNGVEIYEGDIVKLDEGEAVNMGRLNIISGAGGKKYEVFWYQLDWALRILGEEDRYGLGTGLSLSAYGASEYGKHLKEGEQSDTIEVIGNIYEDPDLLTNPYKIR